MITKKRKTSSHLREEHEVRRQIKQDAVRIVAILRRYTQNDDLIWTKRSISWHVPFLQDRIDAAIAWLVASGYLTDSSGRYWVTKDGHEWYESVLSNPQLALHVSYRDFCKEALEGMDIHGAQTKIINAVIPGPIRHWPLDVYIESFEQARDIVRRLSVQLERDELEIVELLREGRIGVCRGIGGHAVQHPGIFHSDGGGRLRSVCANCERSRRASRSVDRAKKQRSV